MSVSVMLLKQTHVLLLRETVQDGGEDQWWKLMLGVDILEQLAWDVSWLSVKRGAGVGALGVAGVIVQGLMSVMNPHSV